VAGGGLIVAAPLSPRVRHQKKQAFLASFAVMGNISAACREAGIHRDTYRYWMEHDEVFGFYVATANQVATEHLEETAYKRAVEGTRKGVYQGGELVGYHTETSDTLLIFLLKARAPEKYRDRYEPPAGAGADGPLRVVFETVDDRGD
jgi:hypothetical protein